MMLEFALEGTSGTQGLGWSFVRHLDTQITELKALFDEFDRTTGDSKIDANELMKVMTDMGEELTDKQIELMISDVDRTNDGTVTFAEFFQYFTTGFSLRLQSAKELEVSLPPLARTLGYGWPRRKNAGAEEKKDDETDKEEEKKDDVTKESDDSVKKKEFEEAWDRLDPKKTGAIPCSLFSLHAKSLLETLSDDDLKLMQEQLDHSDGNLSKDSFMDLMMSIGQEEDEDDYLRSIFNLSDQNGDGKIDVDECFDMFAKLGEKVDMGVAKQMVQEVDEDNDGQIRTTSSLHCWKKWRTTHKNERRLGANPPALDT